jgi:hypothetical protein
MGYSLNQLEFKRRGRPRNTAVHLERTQNILIPQRNTGGPKNVQAELHSVLCNGMQFLVIRRQDDRGNITYLKIDSRTQSVQNSGERCAHRDQFENAPFSPQKGFLLAGGLPTQRKLVRRPVGARFPFSQASHLVIDVAQILGRANNRNLSTLEHFGYCFFGYAQATPCEVSLPVLNGTSSLQA